MRLVLVTADFPPSFGGVQTLTWEVARRIAPRCERFAVVAPDAKGARAWDAEQPFEVRRVRATPDTIGVVALGALARDARETRWDVALHGQWTSAPASIACRALTGYPRKIVSLAHARELHLAPWPGALGRAAYTAIRKGTLRSMDAFIPGAGYGSRLVQADGVPASRCHVVWSGTDPVRFQPRDGTAMRERLGLVGRKVVLTVCRLVGRKGVDTVLEALPEIARRVPDVTYVVVGRGPDKPRLDGIVARLGLADRVRFEQGISHDDLPLVYSAADVYAMPTHVEPPDVEGFGLAYTEASACGLPMVASSAGGVPESVLHDETGLVVTPGDVAATADAIARILEDSALATRLGRAGRARVEAVLNWDETARRYEEVLRGVIA